MKNVYLAAPLFSEAEQLYNAKLAEKLRTRDIALYVPQEADSINDKSQYADSIMIARYDTAEVEKSDVVVAVLDGISIDPGVAAEIGIAFALRKPIVAIYSDCRTQGADNAKKIEALSTLAESQFSYINLYVVGLIKQNGVVVRTMDEAVEAMAAYL